MGLLPIKRKKKPEHSPAEKIQYMVTKQIGRELKKVKAFVLQRLVKRCRKLRESKQTGGKNKQSSASASDDEEDDDDEEEVEEEEGEQEEEPITTNATTVSRGGKGKPGKEGSPAIQACLEEIKAVKALTAEALAPICLRRLGLAYTGTEHNSIVEKANEPGPLKQALEHPRMVTLLSILDTKVTEARRAAIEGEDGGGRKGTPSTSTKGGQKRKRRTNDTDEEDAYGRRGQRRREVVDRRMGRGRESYDGSSVFVDSLAGYVPRSKPSQDQEGQEGDGMNIYGYREAAVKKNRPGQRARRQRFDAIQAALDGGREGAGRGGGRGGRGGGVRGRGFSDRGGRGGGLGGRGESRIPSTAPAAGARQKDGGGYHATKFNKSGNGNHDKGASSSSVPPSPAAAASSASMHPSWVAKQALKAKEGKGGISAFQGKKITFSDD